MAAKDTKASKSAEVSARIEALKDQAVAVVADEPNIHAKELEERLGIESATGDQLYRAMKDDKRFTKREARKATWDLSRSAKAARTKAAAQA